MFAAVKMRNIYIKANPWHTFLDAWWMFWPNFIRICRFNIPYSFIWRHGIVSFQHLKICKHVTPSPEMYVNRICHQLMKWWHPNYSQQAIWSSLEFHSHIPLLEVQRTIQMGKTKKNKRTKKGWTQAGKHYCLRKMILNHRNLRRFRL